MNRRNSRMTVRPFFPRLAAAVACGALMAPAFGDNIAPLGVGIAGVNDATINDAGTSRVNAGAIANINDLNGNSRLDTYFPNQATQTKSFVGIQWPSKRFEQIDSIVFTMATFADGGWFGPNIATPGEGLALTSSHLTEPIVQVTMDGGLTWTTVAATSDYIVNLTGHAIGTFAGGPTSAVTTFTLTSPASAINGIRLIGDNGGPADGNGFLGVFEFEVNATLGPDTDSDGLPDSWERAYGLVVGTNDSASNADTDTLNNLEEYNLGTLPNDPDSDDDTLSDSDEVNAHQTNPLLVDTDGDLLADGREVNETLTNPTDTDSDDDGLTDGDEVLTRLTNPLSDDTDGDSYTDGLEVAQGSDPKNPDSIPNNFAQLLGATAILGVKNGIDGAEVIYGQAGAIANLNDASLTTRSDTWNGNQAAHLAYTHSFAGIIWPDVLPEPIARIEITMATFGDGGWFGKNSLSPAAGQGLTAAHLQEPVIQVRNAEGTWTTVAATSDYTAKMTGHLIGGGGQPNPTSVKLTFRLTTEASDITGIRALGSEGGVASGGFIGVFDVAVRPGVRDVDEDGMEDSWERVNGLVVGTKDGEGDLDGDGLKNLAEFQLQTNPQDTDSDDDGLQDGPEVATHNTNPLRADTDGDTLSDGVEVNTYHSNPLSLDSDGDGYRDGSEVAYGADPASSSSTPANIALIGSGILGVKPTIDDPAQTLVFNAGSAGNITDGNYSTVVDSFNLDANSVSFVGVLWTAPITKSITTIKFHNATFFDGGWFGVNGTGPGALGQLSGDYLVEPTLQTTTDGGTTWTTVAHTSDYLTVGNGHTLPGAFLAPTKLTATFTPTTPITGVNGVRLIGTEGGNAAASVNGGFLGVFELETFVSAEVELRLLNAARTTTAFNAEFDTAAGKTYIFETKDNLGPGAWTTVTTIPGDGARKSATDPAPAGAVRFYRVRVQ